MKHKSFKTSVDHTNSYYSILTALEHRKYMKLKWHGKLYQLTRLPNGLACVPRYFTKLLKPVFAFFAVIWALFSGLDI